MRRNGRCGARPNQGEPAVHLFLWAMAQSLPRYTQGMTTNQPILIAGRPAPVPPFLSGSAAVNDAASLLREFGGDAAMAAQLRAAQSRARDNSIAFCHWREVERLLGWLTGEGASPTCH